MYFAINEFHWKPSDWLSMTDNEKAFVIASINKRAEAQEFELYFEDSFNSKEFMEKLFEEAE